MKIDKATNEEAKELEEKMSNLDQKSKVLVNTYIQAMLDRQNLELEQETVEDIKTARS